MNTTVKNTIRIAAGILFCLLGVAGLFLPILQGILFIIIGLILLAPYSPFISRQLNTLRNNHPHIYARAYAFKDSLKRKFKRSGKDNTECDHTDTV